MQESEFQHPRQFNKEKPTIFLDKWLHVIILNFIYNTLPCPTNWRKTQLFTVF